LLNTGSVIALLAAFLVLGILAELVNIGTSLVFLIVGAAVLAAARICRLFGVWPLSQNCVPKWRRRDKKRKQIRPPGCFSPYYHPIACRLVHAGRAFYVHRW
jgi:hypothetical protein